MKSKFLRMLSMLLVLSFLVSMLTVFASADENTAAVAEDGEETEKEEESLTLIYNRTYDEGWNVENGFNYTSNGGPANKFEVEYETTFEGTYNYFWRLEVGVNANSFMQLAYPGVQGDGSVLEFDIKTDDITNMNNIVNLGTLGASYTDRDDYNLLSVKDNKVYILDSGDYVGFKEEGNPVYTDPIATLDNEWLRIKLVFDYTYQQMPILETDTEEQILEKSRENNKWFQLYVYYGPANSDEELTLWTGAPVVLRGNNGKNIQFFRFQVSGPNEADFGTSICFDNIKAYCGTNKLTNITTEMGYGTAVNIEAEKTVEILGGANANVGSAFSTALAMKVGVDYCYLNGKRVAIDTNADGEAFGAPVFVDDKLMVHLGTVLEHLGYPAYIHPDGMYVDISTGVEATYLVVGKDTATVGNKTVSLSTPPAYLTDKEGNSYLAIALEDVDVLFPGYYADYDDMGLLMIAYEPDVLDRDRNLQNMVGVMKKFVFDYATGEEIYADVQENTNNFEHPYLYGSKEQFDLIHEEYMALMAENEKYEEMDENYSGNPADYPEEFWLWVHYYRLVNSNGEDAYKRYALKDENGSYDTFVDINYDDSTRNPSYSLAQPYLDAYGYDIGGRSPIQNRTQFLQRMAVAYIITRDIKYLQCAYEVAIALSEWTHWGPGHFLNCADSSADFAIYYDLTYNGYKELAAQGITRPNGEPYDTDVLAQILYDKGVYMGYLSTFVYNTPDREKYLSDYLSPVVGWGGFYYSERENNWHAVCVSGMTLASLAIMGECDGKFAENTGDLISDNLRTLVTYGMQQYAPDGSYIEGPGYWNYGTNNFFELCMALDNAAGTNYGLMDTWGIDNTCYYACHSESSDSRTFNFADGAMSSQDTSYFFYVAQNFDDATLYDVRLNQINGNIKIASIVDLVYYPRDIEINAEEVSLDYMPDSIDLFATRSGWESGSLYAAICGGNNMFGHGQIDAGSFVYHNGGNVWLIDLGTEDYNCVGFWPAATRYRFYVMKPEGNNTLAIDSAVADVPYGQVLDSTAPAIDSGSNQYGAYVIYDMKGTFGDKATVWNRGMLLTNDRKTTIIQDELVFNKMQSLYWFAHYYLQNGYASSYGVEEVEISSDGRTAYLKQYMGMDEFKRKEYQTLRLTIVSDNPSLKFEIMDAYTTIHTDPASGTYTKDLIGSGGAYGTVKEHDRSRYRKLAISSGMLLEFKCAVVIEMIDTETVGTSDEIDVGYDFVSMRSWVPTTDMRGMDIENTIERRGTPNVNTHIVWSMEVAKYYRENGDAYGRMITDYYRSLTDAYYAVRMFGADLPSSYNDYANYLKECREEFSKYQKRITTVASNQDDFVKKLMGLK